MSKGNSGSGPKFTSKRPPPLLQLPPPSSTSIVNNNEDSSPLTASTLRDRSPLFTGLLLSPNTLIAFPLPPTTRRAERKKSKKRSDKAMYHLPGALQSLESVESYQYGVAHGTGDSMGENTEREGDFINNANQTNNQKRVSGRQPFYRTSSYGTTSRSGLESSEDDNDETGPAAVRQKSSSDHIRKRASSRASRLSKKTTKSTSSKHHQHHPRRPSTSMSFGSTIALSVYEDALDASYAYADGDDEASDAESIRTDKWAAAAEGIPRQAEENEQSVRSTSRSRRFPCASDSK